MKPGDVLGRYELIEEIGEGGMATVFRARDRELRREVAIKVMFPHLARKPEVVRRFQREARAAAALEHPNILRVYDVGDEGDQPFIVMELVRGRTLLAEIEQQGALLAELVACIGVLLADALGCAHKAGVIHRDVKPANVLIAGDGRVLLADFGVARLETADSLVTNTGALLGTPAYMSPEQAAGDTATAKSDLYSLGATLYQLATGALPFGGTPAKIMTAVMTGAVVAPVRRRAAVGPDLSRAIEQMMRRDPDERTASAAAVADELRAIAAAGGLAKPSEDVAAYLADREGFVATKTPAILDAVIAAGERALVEKKRPRALALANRADSLAPDDPRVKTLVGRAIAGGRGSRRALVLGGVAVVVAGGLGAGALALRSGPEPVVARDAGESAVVVMRDAIEPSIARDAALDDAAVVVMVAAQDAKTAPSHDARTVRSDASARADAGIDAAAVPPPDAPPADAPPRIATTIVIEPDVWCVVSIDGVKKDRASKAPIAVEPGHHVVRCEQPTTGLAWQQTLDLTPGPHVIAATLLPAITVSFDIDATFDDQPHHRGDRVQTKAGQHRISGNWKTLRTSCTVRSVPELDCFPGGVLISKPPP